MRITQLRENHLPGFRAADRGARAEDRGAALRAGRQRGRHLRRRSSGCRRRAASSPRRSTASSRRGRSRRSRAIRSAPTRSTTSNAICTDFEEMHGDRSFADDPAIVGGPRALQRPERDGDRPPEGPRHQRQDLPQLRHAAPRGLPQGAAAHEARGEVRASRCSPSSTRRAPTRASAPRSAASRRRSARTSTRWRACACRSWCR